MLDEPCHPSIICDLREQEAFKAVRYPINIDAPGHVRRKTVAVSIYVDGTDQQSLYIPLTFLTHVIALPTAPSTSRRWASEKHLLIARLPGN